MSKTRTLMVAWTVCLGACNESAGGGAQASVWRVERRSDHGIEFIRTTGDGNALASLEADLRIGKLQGPEHEGLGQIYAVVPFSDGSFAVMDRQVLRVHYYDQSGEHIRSIGAQGEGPGEFGGVSGMALVSGDRLAVYDPRLRRVSVFDASGSLERTIRMPNAPSSVAVNFLYPAPGGFALRVNVRPPDATSLDLFDPALVRFSAESAGRGDTLYPPILPLDSTLLIPGALPGEMISMPLTPSSQWAWHPDGYWVAGTGAEYRVLLIDERGDTLRIIEREARSVPISRPEAAARRAQTEQNMQFRQQGWRWRGPDLPEERAFFQDIRATPDGKIWIRRFAAGIPPGSAGGEASTEGRWIEPVVYDVFDPTGTYLGEVRPPDGFELLTSSGEFVWSKEADSLGVPQLVRYRLTFRRLIQ